LRVIDTEKNDIGENGRAPRGSGEAAQRG